MAWIVQKYGGTSVLGLERLQAVADRAARARARGDRVALVLSAPAGTTQALLDRAAAAGGLPPRELDALLSTGEQLSTALCAGLLCKMGVPARSLTGWQAGLRTRGPHTDADPAGLRSRRVARLMEQNVIPVVAGFQGINSAGDITTLGRGGSDTTAVALAIELGAAQCEICTDVCGVYDRDPNRYPQARQLEFVDYDRMLRLIDDGAKVLHRKCVLLARDHGLPLVVRSAFCEAPGTVVGSKSPGQRPEPPSREN